MATPTLCQFPSPLHPSPVPHYLCLVLRKSRHSGRGGRSIRHDVSPSLEAWRKPKNSRNKLDCTIRSILNTCSTVERYSSHRGIHSEGSSPTKHRSNTWQLCLSPLWFRNPGENEQPHKLECTNRLTTGGSQRQGDPRLRGNLRLPPRS